MELPFDEEDKVLHWSLVHLESSVLQVAFGCIKDGCHVIGNNTPESDRQCSDPYQI